MNTKNKKINRGGSLVEALVSVAIISFVVVSILSGFAQQQADTNRNTDKNMAVMLAEMRMEEMLKFVSGERLMRHLKFASSGRRRRPGSDS